MEIVLIMNTHLNSPGRATARPAPARAPAWLCAIAAVAVLFYFSHDARAQQSGDVEVVQVKPNFYLIAGAGANIGVQIGADGVVLVDSGSGEKTPQVLAAIKKLTDEPIRYVINTGPDPDHVGGNEAISKAGRTIIPLADTLSVDLGIRMTSGGAAPVLAAEGVLLRMSAPTGQKSPYSSEAWPSETFSNRQKAMYMNGEAVITMHQPAAHSDGDSFVLFRRSDVIAAGDILDTTRFPVIDVAHGGTIQGEIDALNRLIDMTIPPVPWVWREGGTYVIPGHGRICEQSDVVEYRDMVTILRDIIQDMIKRGMTLEQVKAADPTKPYYQYGSKTGPWTTDMFVEAVYKSLTAKR
jgi:glyoxylase-like metal-dependent hydrolase (beta-lactamase superfamily II)